MSLGRKEYFRFSDVCGEAAKRQTSPETGAQRGLKTEEGEVETGGSYFTSYFLSTKSSLSQRSRQSLLPESRSPGKRLRGDSHLRFASVFHSFGEYFKAKHAEPQTKEVGKHGKRATLGSTALFDETLHSSKQELARLSEVNVNLRNRNIQLSQRLAEVTKQVCEAETQARDWMKKRERLATSLQERRTSVQRLSEAAERLRSTLVAKKRRIAQEKASLGQLKSRLSLQQERGAFDEGRARLQAMDEQRALMMAVRERRQILDDLLTRRRRLQMTKAKLDEEARQRQRKAARTSSSFLSLLKAFR
eukprot:TRINITY_DN4881_c0_g1_i2.p1 TRINITY_DN4881_c0_g1~~TRINITY_DN4881_c0_g1_i2.p1  ORF type:complete len:305 (-),score=47.45 TRINITY_DN4881_c0_g1_i2:40-954(-)